MAFLLNAEDLKGISSLNIKVIVVDIVQEHIHTSQVVVGHIDFLTKETILLRIWSSYCFSFEGGET